MSIKRLEATFREARKKWKGNGTGSTPEKTERLRLAAVDLFGELGIKSVMDFGCGSDPWLAKALPDAIEYVGVDVVGDVILQSDWDGARARRFIHLTDEVTLPKCDLVFVRDVVAHLSHATALTTLEMLKRTGATWLLCSNYYGSGNTSIKDGQFRPLNLTRLPFHFGEPTTVIDEGFEKKSMALWRFDQILPKVEVPVRAPLVIEPVLADTPVAVAIETPTNGDPHIAY